MLKVLYTNRVSSFIDTNQESRTGNNLKVTLGSELRTFGYFLLDIGVSCETVFISLFLTSSKSGEKMVLSTSQIYPLHLCGFWTLCKTK